MPEHSTHKTIQEKMIYVEQMESNVLGTSQIQGKFLTIIIYPSEGFI